MDFDTRLLNGIGVVSAVVESGSFVRAGESLGLTQSAISRAIARLEERVGIRIFHRNARSVRLTDEGRRFYELVLPHMRGIEDAAVRAAGAAAELRGRLRVNADGAFGHHVLAPRIAAFLDRYPELSVEISVRNGVGDLVAEGTDVGIHFGPPETSALACTLLARTRVLTCASPDYIARFGAPASPRDIARGHQCISIRDPLTARPYGWEFVRRGRRVPVKAQGRLMVADTGSLLGACLGGQGIAQLLEVYSRPLIAEGKLIQLLPDWAEETFPLHVYHHGPNMISAKVQAFLDFVAEIVRASEI